MYGNSPLAPLILPRCLISCFCKILTDFFVLETYDRGMFVAVCMVFGKNLDGLFVAIVCHEPARALWKEYDEYLRVVRLLEGLKESLYPRSP